MTHSVTTQVCKLLLLIFVVLSDGALLSQQPTSKTVEFETVEDFIADLDNVRNEKLKFYNSTDPNSRFPLSMHQSLWDKNIKLSLLYRSERNAKGVDDLFVVDAFGLSTTRLMHEKYPELADEIMKRIRRDVVGKSIDYNDLYDVILALNRELNTIWARSGEKEYDSLIIRAGLANHFSRMSNKRECWLLVEVFHATPSAHDLFVRDVIDHALKAKKKVADRFKLDRSQGQCYPNSHPMVQESRFLEKNQKLKQNRNQVKVIVHNDRLTNAEREATFGFKLIDVKGRKFHQIEGCSFSSVDDRRTFEALSEASDLFLDRVPDGSYLSFEELHLRVGSVANVLQRRFPTYSLIVTIQENKINDVVYSNVHLEVANR